MTKQEAIQAMRKGKKVTHRYFSPNEWMTIESGNIITLEDDCSCFIDEFFRYRSGSSWDDGYELFKN